MSSARPEFSGRNRVRPDAPETKVPWQGVLHDVRGAATAIEALSGLVSDDSPALDPPSRALLDLIQARAEQLGTLCDAVALLQDRPSAQAPLARTIPEATRRLQKFLERSGISLKSLGEIPDRECEARPLAVLLQSILVTAVNAREVSRPGSAHLEVTVVKGSPRIAVELSGPGWGRPALEAVRGLGCPERCHELGPVGVAARHALDGLRASLRAELAGGALTVHVDLSPAPGRFA